MLGGKKIGFALTGSFCTFKSTLKSMEELVAQGASIMPVMSYHAYATDTRFGKAADFIAEIERMTGHPVLHTIDRVEPIGPKKLLDLMIIAPCTGNSLAKLAQGVIDTPAVLACKSHLRNGRPVLIAVSTNDGLAAAGQNIGRLLNTKNVYFVPFGQDDAMGKPTSLVAHMDLLAAAAKAALEGRQIQPLLMESGK